MFVEPSLSVLEVLLQGEHAALRVGDMYWACMNRCAYCDYAAGLQNDLSYVSEVSNFTALSITNYSLFFLFALLSTEVIL